MVVVFLFLFFFYNKLCYDDILRLLIVYFLEISINSLLYKKSENNNNLLNLKMTSDCLLSHKTKNSSKSLQFGSWNSNICDICLEKGI